MNIEQYVHYLQKNSGFDFDSLPENLRNDPDFLAGLVIAGLQLGEINRQEAKRLIAEAIIRGSWSLATLEGAKELGITIRGMARKN